VNTSNTDKLDVKIAAARLGISRSTLYREVKRSAITHHRLGKNRIIFDEADVEEYLTKRLRKAETV
jgi:excisionase family DNA binding protein